MSNWMWMVLGLGAVAVGGMYLYAQSKDKQDPFGFLSDLFQNLNLDTLIYNKDDIPEGTTIHPGKGESLLEWH